MHQKNFILNGEKRSRLTSGASSTTQSWPCPINGSNSRLLKTRLDFFFKYNSFSSLYFLKWNYQRHSFKFVILPPITMIWASTKHRIGTLIIINHYREIEDEKGEVFSIGIRTRDLALQVATIFVVALASDASGFSLPASPAPWCSC